jgi:hypothetical protein
VQPSKENPVSNVYVDAELGNEAFTYELESGGEGTAHVDHILRYNRDPRYMRDMMVYKLTLAVHPRVQESGLSKRKVVQSQRLNHFVLLP